MSDFNIITNHRVWHIDGWGFEIDEYDDGLIRLRYVQDNGGEDKSISCVEGIWPEAVPMICEALQDLANRIKAQRQDL